MTLKFQSPPSNDEAEQADTEAKVRRALGLIGATPGPAHATHAARSSDRFTTDRPKSRFVQDGEVPLVMLRRDNGQHASDSHSPNSRSPASRLDALEKALKTEQQARETAERSLTDAQASIRDLQTKLGHALMVRDEARAMAERVESEKQALQTSLAAEHEARQASDQLLLNAITTPSRPAAAETKSQAEQPPPAFRPIAKKSPGRRVATPKPVKWWVKSK